MPEKCLENFAEFCCGEYATSNVMKCKRDVENALIPEKMDIETGNKIESICMNQSVIDDPKIKHDTCIACCQELVTSC